MLNLKTAQHPWSTPLALTPWQMLALKKGDKITHIANKNNPRGAIGDTIQQATVVKARLTKGKFGVVIEYSPPVLFPPRRWVFSLNDMSKDGVVKGWWLMLNLKALKHPWVTAPFKVGDRVIVIATPEQLVEISITLNASKEIKWFANNEGKVISVDNSFPLSVSVSFQSTEEGYSSQWNFRYKDLNVIT